VAQLHSHKCHSRGLVPSLLFLITANPPSSTSPLKSCYPSPPCKNIIFKILYLNISFFISQLFLRFSIIIQFLWRDRGFEPFLCRSEMSLFHYYYCFVFFIRGGRRRGREGGRGRRGRGGDRGSGHLCDVFFHGKRIGVGAEGVEIGPR
jgi:hypothetical protein